MRARKCAHAKIFQIQKFIKLSTFYIPWMFS
eukprot:UN15475